MSSLLHRWGRLAARRPWRVIGAWLVVVVVVLAAVSWLRSRARGLVRGTRPRLPAGGRPAVAAASDRAGLTAQVVATPLETTTPGWTWRPAGRSSDRRR